MADKLTFENTIRRTKISLLISGIKLDDVKFTYIAEISFRALFYINFIWLYTDVVAEIFAVVEAIQLGKNLIELAASAPCITISVLGTVKSIFLFLNQDIICKIMDKLKRIHPETVENDAGTNDDDKTKESEAKIINDSMKFLNLVNVLFTALCSSVVVAFCLLPAVSMVNRYYTTGEIVFQYPYITQYYFNHQTMQRWPFVYLHQVFSTVIVAANLIGTDTLFYALCLYVEMHFRLLCKRFEKSIVGDEETVKKNFKECVGRHQDLIELVNNMEVVYTKSTLFNIVMSSVLICLSAFILTVTSDVTIVMMFMPFLLMIVSQTYLLCYFGDLLMKSSMAVSLAVYLPPWYECNDTTKKNILFILMRAQKPCKLTACNFADVNLNAFGTIISRSWSYFALLRSMYD